MQIHKNIIFKMKKHSISHSSNQNNSTEITFLKPKFFSQSSLAKVWKLFHWKLFSFSIEDYHLAKKYVFPHICSVRDQPTNQTMSYILHPTT